MKHETKIIFLFSLVLASLAGCKVNFNAGSANDHPIEAGTAEQQAVVTEAANAFLEKLDAGAIDETWQSASPYLVKFTNKTMWSSTLKTLRGSVGKFKARELAGTGFTDTVEGAPHGEYAAIAFETSFSSGTVTEKVVLHKDKGKWKVLGYFLLKNFKVNF
jgi:Protein of unknown function (DUF4019)